MEQIKGNRIDAILNEKNMTRAEFIDRVGLDPSYLYKVIKGKKKNLNLTTAMRIAKALDYPVEVIFIF